MLKRALRRRATFVQHDTEEARQSMMIDRGISRR
jgi:hypothetical protein